MADIRTLAELRTEVRQTADMVNSTFVTDAEIDRQINLALRRLYWRLVRARGSQFYKTSTTINTTANLPVILIGQMMQLLGLDVTISGQAREILPLPDWSKRHDFQNVSGWNTGSNIYYEFYGGNSAYLWPTPTAAHTVTIWYVPDPTELTADGDTADEAIGFEKWITLSVAMYCRMKEESDFMDLAAERDLLQQEIDSILPSTVDAVRPRVIRDVRRRRDAVVGSEWYGWEP